MHETYRMLGKEHEADLEREALKWRRAAEVGDRTQRRSPWHRVLRVPGAIRQAALRFRLIAATRRRNSTASRGT